MESESSARCEPPRRTRHQRGTVILMAVVAMVALIGVAALATDVGHVWAARTELQAAADAAALAAAADLVDSETYTVTLPQADAAALLYGSSNKADKKSIQILATDLAYGDWNFQTQSLDTSVDLTDPDKVTAVRVVARLDGVQNGPVQTVLARVLGRQSFDVGATATGYLGYAGSFPPGTIDLPIAIDCCSISEGQSCTDFCGYLADNPYPNETLLADGVTRATKLEFESTPEQNACWTDFEQDTNISTPILQDIVRDGNSHEFGSGMGIQLDNGDKTPVVRIISEKFSGTGEYAGQEPAGSDLYDPPPGTDSWVVKLPIVACQTEDHCAGNNVVPVVGVICFEIREVNVTPEKEILGRFFCPSPTDLPCDIVGAGSGGRGVIRADRPVLVE